MGGILFLISRYVAPINSGRIFKIFWILKCLGFFEVFSIFILPPEALGIFQKEKKYTPGLGLATCCKNFSSNEWILWICEGENFLQFLGFEVARSPWRRGLANLCLWQLLLYYPRPIHPESFKKFHTAVLEKGRKRGVSP